MTWPRRICWPWKRLQPGKELHYNLGTGRGYSVAK